MPRSYNFDHYTVHTQTSSRALKRKRKQGAHGKKAKQLADAKPRISYGERFAESKDRFQARVEQYEELHPLPEPVIQVNARPIGATFDIEDTELRSNVGEVLDCARRDVRRMRNAVEDFINAGVHVLRMPGEVLKTALRQLRTV